MYKVMSSRQVVYMVELVGELEAKALRERKKAVITLQENGEIIIQRFLATSPVLCRITHSVSHFLSLCLSHHCLSLVTDPSIHPSREHQQCLCSGLHQRITDSKRPAGSRKPALLSRIHSHCQGESLNMRQLFHQRIKRLLLNQCRVWV